MGKIFKLFAKRLILKDVLKELTEKIQAAATDEELAEVEADQKKAEVFLAEIKAAEKEIAEEIEKIKAEKNKSDESEASK